MGSATRPRPRGWTWRSLRLALLGALAVQSVASMRLWSATSDEITHLPSGYAYLKTGELRLNRQHPPLIKLLCALPLLVLDPRLNLDDPNYRDDPPDEWKFGRGFLYGNDADRLLFWGRMPVVVLALVLGWFVARWASELFGPPAGALALFLYALCPTIVAHSHLVTMDLGLACFSFLFLYFLWRLARGGGARELALAGACLGLALATKFSAVILLPLLPLLLVWATLRDAGSAGRALLRAAAIAGIAAAIVYLLYLFPGDPLVYAKDLLRVNRDHDPNRAYYLLGEFKTGGWWYYFAVAFLLKTPLATLGLMGLALGTHRRWPTPHKGDEAFLAAPVVAFVAVTSALADNLGVRYLLPCYPLLLVFASRTWRLFTGGRLRPAVGIALAAWTAASAVRIFPDHLAYFNEAAGGPGRGYRYLDDSDLEWGQDLKRLKAYLDARGPDRVRLVYPWGGSPEYYGIRYDRPTPRDWYEAPSPGTYVVSTVSLVRGLYDARTRGVRSDWLERYEPVDRVGYSFFVYRFGEAEPERRGRPR